MQNVVADVLIPIEMEIYLFAFQKYVKLKKRPLGLFSFVWAC